MIPFAEPTILVWPKRGLCVEEFLTLYSNRMITKNFSAKWKALEIGF